MLRNTVLSMVILCFSFTLAISQDFQVQLAIYDQEVPKENFEVWNLNNVQLDIDLYQFYRYYIGGFNTREEAEVLLSTLNNKGFPNAKIIDLGIHNIIHDTKYTTNRIIPEEKCVEPIFFNSGSLTLDEKSKQILGNCQRILDENPNYSALIQGHTDSKGSARINLDVSKDRARMVRTFLAKEGVDAYRLKTEYYGESAPLAINRNRAGEDVPLGRKLNRRVALFILDENGEIINDFTKKVFIPDHLKIKYKKSPQQVISGGQQE